VDNENIIAGEGKKKLLTIILVSVIFIAVIVAYYRYHQTIDRRTAGGSDSVLSTEPTETEQLLKYQNEELDKLRAQYQGLNISQPTITMKDQVRNLDSVRVKQKTTSVNTGETAEQQVLELDAMRSAANK